MTKAEFKDAVRLAQTGNLFDANTENLNIFDGYGLPGFKKIHCLVEDVAGLIRWECIQLNGKINAEALNNLAFVARRKFIVVN